MKAMHRSFLDILKGGFLLFALLLVASPASAGAQAPQETDLSPDGQAFELNPDAGGNLWISDYDADEVWRFDPASGDYTVYEGLDSASDARLSAAGELWWADYDGGRLGRVVLSSGVATAWTLTGDANPLGTALDIDSAGRVWATDSYEALLYRFDAGSTRLCSYALPDEGSSEYVLAGAGGIWLGDWYEERILKLDPATNRFTVWQLPVFSSPEGLALDGDGALWWADGGWGALARLQPALNRLTTYPLPAGDMPTMIALEGGRVWYSDVVEGTVGVLDPAVASGTSSTLTRTQSPVSPSCSVLGSGSSWTVATRTGTASWSGTVYTPIVNSGGWTVCQLAEHAAPWGLAVRDGRVWVVDKGRQKLLRLPTEAPEAPQRIYLPLVVR